MAESAPAEARTGPPTPQRRCYRTVLLALAVVAACAGVTGYYYCKPAPRLVFARVLPGTGRLYAEAAGGALRPEVGARVSTLLKQYWDITRSPELLHFNDLHMRMALGVLTPDEQGNAPPWIALLESRDAGTAGELRHLLIGTLTASDYAETVAATGDDWQLQEFTGPHNLILAYRGNLLLVTSSRELALAVGGRITGARPGSSLADDPAFRKAVAARQPDANPFIFCNLERLANDLHDTGPVLNGAELFTLRETLARNIHYITAAGTPDGDGCRLSCRVALAPGSDNRFSPGQSKPT